MAPARLRIVEVRFLDILKPPPITTTFLTLFPPLLQVCKKTRDGRGCAATDWFRKTAVYVWRESYSTAAFVAEKRLDLG